MDEILSEHVENLRKRSRILLARVDKNSKRIKKEFEKLHNKYASTSNYANVSGREELCFRRNYSSWKLRNDSSGVGGVLCPDYFHNSLKPTPSMPNISQSGKIQITSKRCIKKHETVDLHRKPVKDCYCCSELKKIQLRSARTQRKNSPCSCCKIHLDCRSLPSQGNIERQVLSPPISCETLRRVQKIDYMPRSQFLRNVQSKISLLQNTPMGDCPEERVSPSCCHKFFKEKHDVQDHGSVCMLKHKTEDLTDLQKSGQAKFFESAKSPEVTGEEYAESDIENKFSKKTQVPVQKHTTLRHTTKKTLSSKKSLPELKNAKPRLRVPSNTDINLHAVDKDCPCTSVPEALPKSTLYRSMNKYQEPEHCKQTTCKNGKKQGGGNEEEHTSDKEVRDLKKFREQNYFDTHGSSDILLSSNTSGSLEQCLLNERLFPEPVKRIHKKDLVVTMPPCATLQRKRIHYFPRYIVRQEKNTSNAIHKKRRCQSCPLTGHAIDLGVLKVRPPINSLALKYEKRLP